MKKSIIIVLIISFLVILLFVSFKKDIPSFVNIKFYDLNSSIEFKDDGNVYEINNGKTNKHSYKYKKSNNTITYDGNKIDIVCYSKKEGFLYGILTNKDGNKSSFFRLNVESDKKIKDYIIPDKKHKYNDNYLHGCLKGCNVCNFIYRLDENGNIVSYARIKNGK